jgi:rod shape-determining protein MreD
MVIKNIPLGSFFIPMPYVLFILMLPFETPGIVLLLASFALGLSVDLFYDTQGMHASACTLMGFARMHYLKLIAPREGYDVLMKPTIHHMGAPWFLSYALLLIFAHHFLFFTMEVFSFRSFFSTLLRSMSSTAITFLFCYVIQFIFYRSKLGKA